MDVIRDISDQHVRHACIMLSDPAHGNRLLERCARGAPSLNRPPIVERAQQAGWTRSDLSALSLAVWERSVVFGRLVLATAVTAMSGLVVLAHEHAWLSGV